MTPIFHQDDFMKFLPLQIFPSRLCAAKWGTHGHKVPIAWCRGVQDDIQIGRLKIADNMGMYGKTHGMKWGYEEISGIRRSVELANKYLIFMINTYHI